MSGRTEGGNVECRPSKDRNFAKRTFARPTWLTLLLTALLAIASCREAPGENELFEVSGRLFVFNYRIATVSYLVTLKPLQEMQEGDVAVASFQNPAGGEDIVVRQKIWPKLPKVTLESPPLQCVVKDKPYNVSIDIEDSTGKVRQTITTTMTSTQDQSIQPDRPLVIGPGYTPNPELAGHPDGKLPDEPKPACPSS